MSKSPLRVIFAGTPDFAVSHLKALLDSEHQLLAVYTQPDRPAGRGRKLQASPVKQLAEKVGLPVYQPASLKGDAEQTQLAGLDVDVMVVVAYGLILPQAVLDSPRLGCLNVHASLLPRWRGAAPIQRAIEAGDTLTGVTIMQMEAGLDTGPVLATVACPIGPRTTADSLQHELATLGPPLLLEVLADLQNAQSHRQAQDSQLANYANKILKPEAMMDWSQDAQVLDRKVRAFKPFPVCYSALQGERVRIWEARPLPYTATTETPGTILGVNDGEEGGIVVRCGEGVLVLATLQLEGGKQLAYRQILNARQQQFEAGRRFDLPLTSKC